MSYFNKKNNDTEIKTSDAWVNKKTAKKFGDISSIKSENLPIESRIRTILIEKINEKYGIPLDRRRITLKGSTVYLNIPGPIKYRALNDDEIKNSLIGIDHGKWEIR